MTVQDSDPRHAGDPLAALVSRISAGEEFALKALYDATSPTVYGLALHILRERELAEEATIDAFTQVWKSAARYDASRGSVLGWILNVARTRAIDVLRIRARRAEREAPIGPLTVLPDPGPTPEQAIHELERGRKLRSALSKLPIEQRRAIETAYFRGLTHSEVAEELGQPLGTIKTRIRDGLAALRRSMSMEQEGLA